MGGLPLHGCDFMAWYDGLAIDSAAFEIAQSAERRIRVLAGPGAGKSFAMKRRVARLLEDEGVHPDQLLPVTFTRVAAEDLHRELVSLEVEGANRLAGRTLHSLAMSILMRGHVLHGVGRTPRPLNEFELQPLLEDLSVGFGNKTQRKKRLDAYLAAWARLQHEAPGHAVDALDAAFAHDVIGWLRHHEAMLIGEAIPMLHTYLTLNPAAPERQEFTHILVDEYQDLNRAEQQVIELLGGNAEICIIGDDDQSVYSFKYAHPAGIREWGPHVGAQDFAIAECRRCPTSVVAMANSLISHNVDRQPRVLGARAENGVGVVRIRQFTNVEAEAEGIVADIQQLIATGSQPGEIIVLCRKIIARPIYALLRQQGVPAKSYYAEMPLDTKDAQERFALLKLHLNNEDRVALRWLLGCHHARWHSSQYARIFAIVLESGLTPFQVMSQLAAGFLAIPNTGTLIARFHEIRAELDTLDAATTLEDFTTAWLPPAERTALLTQVVAEHSEGLDTPLQLFESLQMEFTQPEIPLQVAEVRLMSFYKSKGLSSPFVYMAGCAEGLIPSRPYGEVTPMEISAKLEEDRRLFFVAMTRVKADPAHGKLGYLHISYPRTMARADAMHNQVGAPLMRGQIAYLHASRFLGELGPQAPVPEHG